MKYSNLKDGLCPMDASVLQQSAVSMMIVCPTCSFKISESRLQEIIRYGYKPKEQTVGSEEEQLEQLNNLGRKPFNPHSF